MSRLDVPLDLADSQRWQADSRHLVNGTISHDARLPPPEGNHCSAIAAEKHCSVLASRTLPVGHPPGTRRNTMPCGRAVVDLPCLALPCLALHSLPALPYPALPWRAAVDNSAITAKEHGVKMPSSNMSVLGSNFGIWDVALTMLIVSTCNCCAIAAK